MKTIYSFITFIILSFFLGAQIALANTTDTLDNLVPENTNKISKSNESDNLSQNNNNEADIFGDEQTFPFVAGLGKNAAH